MTAALGWSRICDRRPHADKHEPIGPDRLYPVLCDGATIATISIAAGPMLFFGASIGIVDCLPGDGAAPYGSWPLDDDGLASVSSGKTE